MIIHIFKKFLTFFSAFLVILIAPADTCVATLIKAVIFDFGGVIATVDRCPIIQFLMNTFAMTEEELQPIYRKMKIFVANGGSDTSFFQDYATSIGKPLPANWVEQFAKSKQKSFAEIPGSLDLVKGLQRMGYQTAMLSNIPPYHASIIRQLGYYDYFHPVVLSYEIGFEKPHLQAFLILLGILKLPPDTCLFIDDHIENVEAARKVGMSSILFTTPHQLFIDLNKIGIELQL